MIPSVLPTYNRAPLQFVKGEGSWLIEADGRRFLDLGAGIAVNALGHAHPALVQALTDQAQTLWHVSNLYEIPQQQQLADQLVDNSFADTVFFTNSGTESCELAVKMARKYWYDKGQPEKVEIITFDGAFHGRSSAGIAAAGTEKMTKGFGPLLPGFVHLTFGDMDGLTDAITDKTAAILIERVDWPTNLLEAQLAVVRRAHPAARALDHLLGHVSKPNTIVNTAFQHHVVIGRGLHAEAAKTLRVIGFDMARNNRNVHRTNRQHG